MELIPLGANGYFPSYGRQTMSFLVLAAGRALLLDAGTGVSRLGQPELAARIERADSLDVILSHYHLDHIVGLSYLPAVWSGSKLRIFGPAPPLAESDPRTALQQLFRPPLFPKTMEKWPCEIEIVPVEGEEIDLGGLRVRVRGQRHPGGSMGVRLGDEIAYLTDTGVDFAGLPLALGVRLLLHELWLTDEEAEEEAPAGHSTLSEVARFARDARVERLCIVHHHPKRPDSEIGEIAARTAEIAGLPVFAGKEGEALRTEA